jgi:hypothetical protein
MLTLLGSREAFLVYGAALGWCITHWTVVKTAEVTLLKLLGNKKTETIAAAPPPAGAPPAA